MKLDDTPEPDETSAQPKVPSASEGEALRIEGEQDGVTPNLNWQGWFLVGQRGRVAGKPPPFPERS